ncbi:YbaB/EbfC family nucleoid-associated protein [Streptomyces hyaluromycini]|uniref:YbaB/EbfC family nucleoid-associated protein n=1 Tax=Streptomyces hyaluromycini TaxID=1377993 RepID=A0ABV1X2Q7_9ACTN|nr:YbaB/EbfC family nucleoid-associated protein [Streptomyces hyaluromycini]
MSESLQHQFAQAMAEFEKQREALVRAREEISAVSVTARSKDRAVEVTLGADGSPSGLRFLGNKHQTMSGKALAASVLEAMARARTELTAQVRARFDEVAGPGIGVAGGGTEAVDKLAGSGLEKLMGPLTAPGGLLHPERGGDHG